MGGQEEQLIPAEQPATLEPKGEERHLCSLKLDSRLLLSLLPNSFPVLFQRDIGVRRPARVGISGTLERKIQAS